MLGSEHYSDEAPNKEEKIYNNNDIQKIKDYLLINKETNEGYTYQLREQ